MKCPKCHYLSFDPEPRCRNCGYTLSLDPDLVIHEEPAPDAPLVDLTLRESTPAATPPPEPSTRGRHARRTTPVAATPETPRPRVTTPGPFDLTPAERAAIDPQEPDPAAAEGFSLFEPEPVADPVPPPSPAAPEPRARRPAPAAPTAELPLFVKGLGGGDTPPTASTPAASLDPRRVEPPDSAPPTVRPAAPDIEPRTHGITSAPKLGPLDRDLLEGLERLASAEQRRAAESARLAHLADSASASRRVGAALADGVLLGALAAVVASVTLRWADLDWSRWAVLPLVPMAAFVLLIVAGYLFMFTAASGQTAGKMLMGIRVVDGGNSGTEEQRVSARQALYRSVMVIPSVLMLGIGFIPALTGDRRALHDRLTGTRVVRA